MAHTEKRNCIQAQLKDYSLYFFLMIALLLSGCVQVPDTQIIQEPSRPALSPALNLPAKRQEFVQIPVAEDKDAILKTIDSFFEALASGNARRLEQLVSRGAIDVTSYPEEPGRPVRYGKTRAFAAGMRNGTAPKIEEPYWDPIVLQRKSLAVVWTPYEVWVNERLSHCGIDVFTLTLQKTTWRIDGIHWTQEPSACEELWPNGRSVLRPDMFTTE